MLREVTRMTTKIQFGRIKDLQESCEDVRPRLEEALAREGFGILTEIDVRSTLKAKLDEDVPAQWILGACNPPIAFRALQLEPELGLLLPCNIVLREIEGGGCRVAAVTASALFGVVGEPELAELAEEVDRRLGRVLESLDD